MAANTKKFRVEFPGVVRETLLEEGGSLDTTDDKSDKEFKVGDEVKVTWGDFTGTITRELPRAGRYVVTIESGSILECSASNLVKV